MITGRLRQLIEGAPAGARAEPVKLTLRTLDPITIAWLVARAGAFVKCGRRSVPAWGYAGLARNLKRSRKVVVHPKAIERMLKRVDPELARRRGDCYYIARRQRRKAEERRAAKVGK